MSLFKRKLTFDEEWDVIFKVAKEWRGRRGTTRSCYRTNECLLPSEHLGDCLGLDPGPVWDRALKLTTEWFSADEDASFCEREVECLRPFGHAGGCWPFYDVSIVRRPVRGD